MPEYMTLLIPLILLTVTVTVSAVLLLSQYAHSLTLTEQNATDRDAKYCDYTELGYPHCYELLGYNEGYVKSYDDWINNRTCDPTPPPGHTLAFNKGYAAGYGEGDCMNIPSKFFTPRSNGK